jgi:hypothetical protein
LSLNEIFDYSNPQHDSIVDALVSCLGGAGLAVHLWLNREPKISEPLPLDELVKLIGGEPQIDDAMISDGKDIEVWRPILREVMVTYQAGFAAQSSIISRAVGQTSEGRDDIPDRVVEILESSPNRGLVWGAINVADHLARNDESIHLIPNLYEYAIRKAPRPSIHNELGAILLARAGVEPESLGSLNDIVLTAANYGPGGTELLSADEPSSIVPEHRKRLVELAASAFAASYGYWVESVRRENFNSEEDTFFQACCALDGLRVASHQMGLDLQELLYANYDAWDDAYNEGGLENGRPEFTRRFAYSLGLSRGSENRSAVREAEQAVSVPLQNSLLDKLAAAVTTAMRSVSSDQLREGQTAASKFAGEEWVELPIAVRDQLAQAEYMESVLWHSSFDWAPVALPYFRAIEILLRDYFGSSLSQHLGNDLTKFLARFNLNDSPHDCSTLTMGQFAFLIRRSLDAPEMQSLIKRTRLHTGSLRDVAGRLSSLNRQYRNLAAHGGEPWGGPKILEVKRAIYDRPRGSSESLLSLLTKLRVTDRRA